MGLNYWITAENLIVNNFDFDLASTLAKLRQGARNFFSSRQLDGNQDISTNNDDNVPNQEPASSSSDANNSRLNRSAQGDDMELDVLSENEGVRR